MTYKKIYPYLLLDYRFLQDYQVLDSMDSTGDSFIARIKDTTQMVKFTKVQFSEELFPRFEALVKLFKSGVILADNIFMLEQCSKFYFYVIEAYLNYNNLSLEKQRFRSLQQSINGQNDGQGNLQKQLLTKIKVLLQKVHQSGQYYGGLSSTRILIDDDSNVYLSPFNLTHQLPNTSYQHAYRPPQILAKILQLDYQIQQRDIAKWDIWSFGCICLEIFVVCSPFYHSPSLNNQLGKIKDRQLLKQAIQDLQQPVRNLVINCLTINPEQRHLSSHKKQISTSIKGKNSHSKPKNIDTAKKIIKKDQQSARKNQVVSIYHTSTKNSPNSELTLHLLSLMNAEVDQQLQITIYIGKAFNYYSDPASNKEKTNKIIYLDKKIIIQDSYDTFNKILSEPILIELKEGQKTAKIRVSLQTLVMVYEGKRVWDKQLIGSYEVEKSANFYTQAKIKLSCYLKTPEIVNQSEYLENQRFQSIIKTHISNKINSVETIQAIVPKVQPNKPVKQQIKDEKQNQVPTEKARPTIKSIQDVKNSLNDLANHWKKRNSAKSLDILEGDNQLEGKIDSLLEGKIDNLLRII